MNDLFYPHYDAWTTVYDSQLNYWTPENTNSYFPVFMRKRPEIQMPIHVYRLVIYRMDRT